jgi:hypothetical protein
MTKVAAGLALFVSFGAIAAPSVVRISEYPNATVLGTNDLFVVAVDAGRVGATNKNVRWGQMVEMLEANPKLSGLPAGAITNNQGDVALGNLTVHGTLTASGSALLAGDQTFTGQATFTQPMSVTGTNSVTQNISFKSLSYVEGDFATNANFAWLGFSGTLSSTYQTAVVWLTNSSGSPISFTVPAGTHTLGTLNCTNATELVFRCHANRWTNLLSLPLW